MRSKKIKRFIQWFKDLPDTIFWQLYDHAIMPARVWRLRHKKSISVVFAVSNLASWKTERLYRQMVKHPRFSPMLAIVIQPSDDSRAELRQYFREQGYPFRELAEDETICRTLSPDIIFFQHPYEHYYVPAHSFERNRNALFCYVIYSMRSSTEWWATDIPLIGHCWQVYYENSLNLETYRRLNKNHAANGLATGLPVMDELLTPAQQVADPWKPSAGKKRIIYAPHHTITDVDWMQLSTCLTLGPIMLELAEKYSDRVQWAFKPHPWLRGKLETIWGKEATDRYFDRWSRVEWSQFESGTYLGLLKHSDAMIHDCGSFTMEYLFTGKPVMYLLRPGGDYSTGLNEMHRRAFALHYHATSRADIEQFINDVLTGTDPLKEGREHYLQTYLIPPATGCATTNIISALLSGKSESRFRQ